MIGRPRKAVAASVCGLGLLASPSAADAAVSITVPGPVNLGAAPVGATTYGAQMGTVTATATGAAGILPSFTATVSSSTFVTGGGTAAETFPKGSISYWSGPVTASTGRLRNGASPMRRLVVTVAAAVLALVGAVRSSAQTPPTPQSVGIRIIDVPTGRSEDPRARQYIVDHLAPGTTITRRVEVTNGTGTA